MNLPGGARKGFNLSDLSTNANLYAGYFIIKNLSAYGKIGLNTTMNEYYTNELSSYGAGMCYYIMPKNMFVNFDISSGHDKIEAEKRVGGGSGVSERGLLFNIGLGKEWMVSKHWGIGGMLYYFTGSIDDQPFENQTPVIKHTGFGLSFTTTFN